MVKNEFLEALIRASPLAVVALDGQGRVLLWSPAAERLFGWRAEEVLGQPAPFVPPEERAAFRAMIEQELKGETRRELELSRLRKDGSRVQVNLWTAPLHNPQGEIIGTLGLLADIGRRKQVEERLRMQAQLLDAVGQAIIATDLRGTITYWNRAAERLYGWPAEEVLGRDILEVTPAAAVQEQAAAVMARVRGGQSWRGEFRVRRRDGSTFTAQVTNTPVYDERGDVIGIIGISQDISERIEAEEEIRRHAAHLEALAQISQALAAASLDSQAVLETIVRQTAELVGDACVLALLSKAGALEPVAHHHSDPQAKALMSEVLAAPPLWAESDLGNRIRESGLPVLISNLSPEQARQVVQPEYRPYLDQVGLHSLLMVPLRVQGRIIGTLGVTRDAPGRPYTAKDRVFLQSLADRAAFTITNAKLFEAEQTAREELRRLAGYLQTAREEERAHIAREIHDELGQALTALKMDLAWLARRLPADPPALAQKAAAMSELIDATVQTVRRVSSQLRPGLLDDLGLAAAIEWQLEEFGARTGIRCQLRLPEREPDLDPALVTDLFRILQETLTNVARHAGATEVRVALEQMPDALRLTVRDDGRGITPDQVTDHGSLGILGIRERARAWNGQLTIEGQPGQGTAVRVHIPWPGGKGEPDD